MARYRWTSFFGLALSLLLIGCTPTAMPQTEAVVQASPAAPPVPVHILFIGNSLTYFNDLPAMFQRFSTAGGHPVVVDSSTASNYTLDAHANPQDPVGAKTLAKIRHGGWGYVIMQDLSQRATYPNQRARMLAGVQVLAKEARQVHARVLLYQTWAFITGDATFPEYPRAHTFSGMQAMIRESYEAVGQSIGAAVIPAGEAWPAAVKAWPAVAGDLWQTDGNHPRPAGTLMNVAVIYRDLWHADPTLVGDHEGVSQPLADFVLHIAATVPL